MTFLQIQNPDEKNAVTGFLDVVAKLPENEQIICLQTVARFASPHGLIKQLALSALKEKSDDMPVLPLKSVAQSPALAAKTLG